MRTQPTQLQPPSSASLSHLLCLFGGLLGAVAINLFWGAGNTSSLAFDAPIETVLEIRLPRLGAALLAGAALAVAGSLSQGFFRNSLASPSVLGLESGGNLLATAVVLLLPVSTLPWATPLGALTGSLLFAIVLYTVTSQRQFTSTAHLLMTGVALSSFAAALTSLVIATTADEYRRLPMLMHWLLGSFSAVEWSRLAIAAIPVSAGVILAGALGKRIELLVLGEDVAATLGVNLSALRVSTISTIALLLAGAISLGGAIPFVGLVVPHILRRVGGPRQKFLLWSSAIGGATLTAAADFLARSLISPEEIPAGVVTALIGAPFFLYVLLTTRGDEASA